MRPEGVLVTMGMAALSQILDQHLSALVDPYRYPSWETDKPPPMHDKPPPTHDKPPPIHDNPPPIHDSPLPIHDTPSTTSTTETR